MDSKEAIQSVNQNQVHDLLFNREIGWQDIIYDLINTEQLDPWNIDIVILTDKYLVKIQNLEETDFFVSSKVLLAASLLLRIKSEILLNKYIKSIDDILFGKEEKKKYELERIELEEGIPDLVPRSPIPRFKKVTLKELVESLNKAISTENRRIKKEILHRNALRETAVVLPKRNFSIKNKIKEIYDNLFTHFKENGSKKKVSFTEFIGKNKEDRIISFGPLLHLENQKKVWLEQKNHFDEIFIWLKHVYFKHNPNPFADLKEEITEKINQLKKYDKGAKKRIQEINKNFENPLAHLFD
ncbi:MAG: segregation/condensation protein A [Nanoarchaeota archaeon]|nr:segregation/condensation protein A [Nanoarchaeota archaeon]MBU1027724.1 segregation/condensation protein A [Nanoarchaeota archaeon]